uniref:hypothetical protein n=1 Tax=Spizellomyces sp. 'palustris' TaxID=117820 RepID=UPI0010FC3BDF|nr:hypothetical protein [Spizellomyces sp. 'palustris']QCQ69047.1 hypothetical protein [Spizellomyces sp. 'palustris']
MFMIKKITNYVQSAKDKAIELIFINEQFEHIKKIFYNMCNVESDIDNRILNIEKRMNSIETLLYNINSKIPDKDIHTNEEIMKIQNIIDQIKQDVRNKKVTNNDTNGEIKKVRKSIDQIKQDVQDSLNQMQTDIHTEHEQLYQLIKNK